MSELTKRYINKYDILKGQLEDWLGDWQDIATFILPRTGKFDEDEKPGDNESGRYGDERRRDSKAF